jgi:hypothetical protein
MDIKCCICGATRAEKMPEVVRRLAHHINCKLAPHDDGVTWMEWDARDFRVEIDAVLDYYGIAKLGDHKED